VLSLGSAIFRAEYRYQSRIFFDVFEDPFTSQAPTSVVNARIAFEARDGHWFLAVSGRNLTDELVAHNKTRLDGQTGKLQFWTSPRMIEFRFGLRY